MCEGMSTYHKWKLVLDLIRDVGVVGSVVFFGFLWWSTTQ